MNKAIATLCKALGQLLDANFMIFDRETSDLMSALAEWMRKYDK